MNYSISTNQKSTSARGTVALKQALSDSFCGEHVSVKFTRPSGITQVRYITVSESGEITDTYRPELKFENISWS